MPTKENKSTAAVAKKAREAVQKVFDAAEEIVAAKRAWDKAQRAEQRKADRRPTP